MSRGIVSDDSTNLEPEPGPQSDRRAGEEVPESLPNRFRTAAGFPIVFFLAAAIVLFVVVWVSNTFMARTPSYPIKTPLTFTGDGLFEGWVRYDGGWYRYIADNGYFYEPGKQSPIAFFPTYPLGMRFLGAAIGDSLLGGIVLTFACGLATAVLFYRWACVKLSPATARLGVVLMFMFPYAWYLYGAVYADALFIVCAVGAFVLVERDRPVLAGLAAGVATATRPIGMGLVIGLILVGLERHGVLTVPYFDAVKRVGWRRARRVLRSGMDGSDNADGSDPVVTERSAPPSFLAKLLGIRLRRLRPGDAGLLLSLSGLVAWCAYLKSAYGDPFAFVAVEGAPGWDQKQGPETWFKVTWLQHLHHLREYLAAADAQWYNLTYTLGISLQGALAIACVLLIPLVIKRVGWPYAVFVLMVVALPAIGSKDWQGTGRYLLAAFPVFAALADWLVETDRRGLRNGLVAGSAFMLIFLTSAYARGYYLA